MLFGFARKLEENIVICLLNLPQLSARSIQNQINIRMKKRFSIQAVYQELRKLRNEGIVVKRKDIYSLRLGWLIAAGNQVNLGYRNYFLKAAFQADLLPLEGKRKVFNFNSLVALLPFFANLATYLILQSRSKCYFEYIQHIWYHLVNPQDELQYISSVKQNNAKYYLISRSNTKLDKIYLKLMEGDKKTVVFGRDGLFKNGSKNISKNIGVVSTMVLEFRMPKKIEELYHSFYQNNNNLDKALDAQRVLNAKGKYSIVIYNNKLISQRIHNSFTDYLGLKRIIVD